MKTSEGQARITGWYSTETIFDEVDRRSLRVIHTGMQVAVAVAVAVHGVTAIGMIQIHEVTTRENGMKVTIIEMTGDFETSIGNGRGKDRTRATFQSIQFYEIPR